MGHPMEDYWHGEGMARDHMHARYERVLEALKDVPLSEFTVGQLWDVNRLVAREWGAPEVLERLEALVAARARTFKHGMSVRYKHPKKGQHGLGTVTSRPRRGSRFVCVKGPGARRVGSVSTNWRLYHRDFTTTTTRHRLQPPRQDG